MIQQQEGYWTKNGIYEKNPRTKITADHKETKRKTNLKDL